MFYTVIIPAGSAIIVFIGYMIIIQFLSKKGTVNERMQRLFGNTVLTELPSIENYNEPVHADQQYSSFGSLIDAILRAAGINTEEFRKKSLLRFYRAGIASPDAPVIYQLYKYICGPALVLVAIYVLFLPSATTSIRIAHLLVTGILAVLGVMGADLYINNQRDKRQKILGRSFPDALDLLLVCIDSGLALDGALSRVCRELGSARPEITLELNRTRIELTLLNDRARALTNLAERTDTLPFRLLVSSLIQSERFGTSLIETLRVLSEEYRNMRLMSAEEKAGRLPTLITIPLITLMMPALFLIILGPAIIETLNTMKNM